MFMALKMEEGALTERMWVASRSWKRQGNGFTSSRKKGAPASTLIISLVRLVSDF